MGEPAQHALAEALCDTANLQAVTDGRSIWGSEPRAAVVLSLLRTAGWELTRKGPIVVACTVLLPDSKKLAAAATGNASRQPRIPSSILDVFSGLFGLGPDPGETDEAFLERAGRVIGERRERARRPRVTNGDLSEARRLAIDLWDPPKAEIAADWLTRRGETVRWRS